VVFNNLSEGSHSFKVRATDNASNTGSPAYHDWVVDITRPITTILSAPSNLSNSDAATFSFTNNEDNMTQIIIHECILDDETNWSECSSPAQYDNLSEGDHTFIVWTIDEAGNVGDPVQWNWTIDTEPPVAAILEIYPQIAYFNVTEVHFVGSGTDQIGYITAYEWNSSIDGTISTSQSFSADNLSYGNHTISFRVRDAEGLWSDYSYSNLLVLVRPQAIAGDSITVKVGGFVQFVGNGTDIDGVIMKYEWDFDGDGLYDVSSSETGRATNVYYSDGTYVATLRVTDDDGLTSVDTVTITVTPESTAGSGTIAGFKGEYIIVSSIIIALALITTGYLIKKKAR
jgi:hypothetical protein